jgi:NAD(P)-dependent dehydrogenase (short-subunit alcohol dehydrogenase family)
MTGGEPLQLDVAAGHGVPDSPAQDSRIALVTGGSRGIGLAISLRLTAADYHVIVSSRSREAVEQAVAACRAGGGQASGLTCDVGSRDSLDQLMDTVTRQYGRLDVLVNNAGVLPPATRAEQVTDEEWDRTLGVNLSAPWILARRAHALMKDRGGVIVNITSTAAHYPTTGFAPYNVSKAGLTMLTRVLALEWARDGIRVLAVAPGKIDTDLLTPIKVLVAAKKIAVNPQERIGQPGDVAALVSFLTSDAAAYITGVVVPVDGGELLIASSAS